MILDLYLEISKCVCYRDKLVMKRIEPNVKLDFKQEFCAKLSKIVDDPE